MKNIQRSAFAELEIKARVEGHQMPLLEDNPFSEIISVFFFFSFFSHYHKILSFSHRNVGILIPSKDRLPTLSWIKFSPSPPLFPISNLVPPFLNPLYLSPKIPLPPPPLPPPLPPSLLLPLRPHPRPPAPLLLSKKENKKNG